MDHSRELIKFVGSREDAHRIENFCFCKATIGVDLVVHWYFEINLN